jgi:hypothetical protein
MRSKPGMTRILISLLFLRMLAAPIAARPDTPKPPSTDRFIVRFCAWPAQRPQCVNSATVLRPSFRGSRCFAGADWIAVSQAHALGSPGRSALSLLITRSFHGTSALRLDDSPRC